MTNPLYKCMTKATTAEGDQIQYGPNWLKSRRASLSVFEDRFECGDWTIQYTDILEATLFSIRSTLLIPGYVLKVQTSEKTYHFGLNWGGFWKGELPFEVNRKKGRLGYSKFSLAVRFILLAYLCYWLWAQFFRQAT